MAPATRVLATERFGARVREADLVAALDRTLAIVDGDDRLGPLMGAARLRLRLELTDLGIALNVAADEGGRNLSWSFAERPDWTPRLVLRMTAATANRYLQGRLSLPIAIAHGDVRIEGDSRCALTYLPAAHLLAEPYRRVVETDFPQLVER